MLPASTPTPTAWPRFAPAGPSLAQVAPIRPQESPPGPSRPQVAPGWPQAGPRLAPCWPPMAGPRLAPAWPQVAPRTHIHTKHSHTHTQIPMPAVGPTCRPFPRVSPNGPRFSTCSQLLRQAPSPGHAPTAPPPVPVACPHALRSYQGLPWSYCLPNY